MCIFLLSNPPEQGLLLFLVIFRFLLRISETIDLVYLGMQVVPKYALFTHNIVVQDGAPNAFVVIKIVMRLKS
jgi:hypothetical protein